MKKLKLLFITILVIFATISMAACKSGSKTNDTTKRTDENQTSTNSTSISTNTTPDMTDAAPWPKDFIKGVPELTGRIADVYNKDTDVTVHIEYVKKVDFENYIKQLKSNGYTVESGENSNAEKIEFGGNNADGDSVYTCFFIAQDGNVGVSTVYMKKASK